MHGMARVVACAVVASLAVGVAAAGRQLVVSKEGVGAYRSVQAAMNDAESGDTILVNPGVYEEAIEFRNGVTVTGSGAAHTVIRYGYGFDEVLYARNIVSGRIERVTLERMTSVLDAPVVVLDEAVLTFSQCVITGGRPEGIRVSGISARAILEECDVVDNAVYGVACTAGAELRLRGGSVSDNRGAGVLVADGSVSIAGTRFEGNGAAGLVLDAAFGAALDGAAFEGHAGWGVDCLDAQRLDLVDCRFADNASGGLRVGGTTLCSVRSGLFDGGAVGIEAAGSSAIDIDGGTIREATRAGIRVLDDATCWIEQIEVVECGGNGVELASSGSSEVRHATIVRNDGDGVLATGATVAVTDSIVALNGGAGLSVSQASSGSTPPTFGYNVVWANASGDYAGTTRRPSDVSGYPGFADAARSDYSLRDGSPCIGAGRRGATIGAHADPTHESGAAVDLTIGYTGGALGLDVAGAVRLLGSSPYFEESRLRAVWSAESAGFSVESSFLGAGSAWIRGDGEVRFLNVETPSASGSDSLARASFGVAACLDGVGSRASFWASGEVVSDALSVRAEYGWERPTAVSRQELDVRLGGFEVSTAATAWTLNVLEASLDGELARPGGVLRGSAALSMLPEPSVSLEAGWSTVRWGLETRLHAYVADLAAGDISLAWADFARGSRIVLEVKIAGWVVADAALRAEFEAADASIEAEVGVNAALGVRLRLDVEIDTARWLLPVPNLPPVPAFTYGPDEPEATDTIAFDASATVDPDGAVLEYWWDFGDGTVELGTSVSHCYERAGEYAVALTVADDAGDTATLVRTIVVFDADTTPIASFTWGPVSEAGTNLLRALRAGDRVQFDATSSRDPDGSIVEFAWDFESDGMFDLISEEPMATADPLAPGTWPVTLRVVDDTGRADAIMRVLRVEEPRPPEAGFDVSPSAPSIYDPVRFIDRSIAIDGPIVAWEWALGDGHASREAEPIHRYEQVGRYEVTLTVTDSLGLTGTHSQTLDVQRTPGIVPVVEVWALVIGISEYEEVGELPYARRDAEAIAEWLLDNGVPPDHIRLLTDGRTDAGVVGLSAAPATLVNVREGLGWLRRVASQDDLVLIHFSGHGYQGADDGADEPDGVDEFFVLHDTRSAAKDDTALRDDEFGRFLDRIASDRVLIFFDSCYSGGLSRSLPPGRRAAIDDEEDWFGDLRLEGRLLLSASSEGEEAFESPQVEHGVFTHFLLEGLRGAADVNGDFHVTVWELYEYVAAQVPPFVAAERGQPQHPQLFGEGDARIVLSLRDRPLEAAFSYCPPVPYAGGSVVFADESAVSGEVERAWSFGDGASAVGDRVEHAFADAGTYEVTLTVTGESGGTSQALVTVRIEPSGRIVALNEAAGRAIVSLGARNGLHVGDRFASGGPDPSNGPILEVVELLDEDGAVCTVDGGIEELRVDDPLTPVRVAPCVPSG